MSARLTVRTIKASFISLCLSVAVTGVAVATPSATSPPPSGSAVANGEVHWAAGRLDEAEQAFAQAFKANPQSTKAGMKRVGFAHQDTAWSTVCHTQSTDLETIENEMTNESAMLQTRTLALAHGEITKLEDKTCH